MLKVIHTNHNAYAPIMGKALDLGDEIVFNFDYGWYTSTEEGLNPNEFEVTEDTLDGHFRQIVWSINPLGTTKLYIHNIADAQNSSLGYNSLLISTSNLSAENQDKVIGVFENIIILE